LQRIHSTNLSAASVIAIIITRNFAGPQRETVATKLHDQRRVLVRVLAQRVQLGNSTIERILCLLTSFVRLVEYLVEKYAEVEGQAESDRMAGSKVGPRECGGALVFGKRRLGETFAFGTRFELSQVSVVVLVVG
jgi:hypothetical protein